MKTLTVTIAALMAWGTAMAAEAPSIIQGFGKTKWGQTKEEVTALVTLSPVKPPADKRGGPDIVAVGDGPIDRVAYYFTHDRLVWVDAYIALPAGVEPSMARAAIQEVIDAKYGDRDSVKALSASDITIRTEQDPQQGGKGVCVRYRNNMLEREIERQELDRRGCMTGMSDGQNPRGIWLDLYIGCYILSSGSTPCPESGARPAPHREGQPWTPDAPPRRSSTTSRQSEPLNGAGSATCAQLPGGCITTCSSGATAGTAASMSRAASLRRSVRQWPTGAVSGN